MANSLTLVASLVRLQARSADSQSAKAALGETETRIYAIADVHKRLYNSGDVGFVALNEYLADLLTRLESSMHSDGHGATLKFNLDPVKLAPDASVNLGIVVNELVTNAFKYAYPDSRGEVRVSLKKIESDAILEMLYRHIETPEFCVRFHWRADSVAFWDNRCTQHQALWDYFPHKRYGHRVTICGDKPF